MSSLAIIDIVCLSVLLMCALDIIRQTNPLRHPFHAVGFFALALGASAWILQDLSSEPQWYSVVFHGGLCIYSALGAHALWAANRKKPSVQNHIDIVVKSAGAGLEYLATPHRRKEDQRRYH